MTNTPRNSRPLLGVRESGKQWAHIPRPGRAVLSVTVSRECLLELELFLSPQIPSPPQVSMQTLSSLSAQILTHLAAVSPLCPKGGVGQTRLLSFGPKFLIL